MSQSAFMTAVTGQFGRPSGLLGGLAGLVMAHRSSNLERNRRTLDLLDIQPEDRVLEIGFGPGVAVGWAAERAARGCVVGVDHSELMLRMAVRRNARAVAAGRVRLYQASADSLPAFAEPFDKAYAVNVHFFWRDPAATLQRIAGVLRPGGSLALTVQPRRLGATAEDTLRARQQITASLEAAGLCQVRSELFDLKPVPAVCVLGTAPALRGIR